ncbi:unnamed protein product, partial [Nesidiocoris tenuis]
MSFCSSKRPKRRGTDSKRRGSTRSTKGSRRNFVPTQNRPSRSWNSCRMKN